MNNTICEYDPYAIYVLTAINTVLLTFIIEIGVIYFTIEIYYKSDIITFTLLFIYLTLTGSVNVIIYSLGILLVIYENVTTKNSLCIPNNTIGIVIIFNILVCTIVLSAIVLINCYKFFKKCYSKCNNYLFKRNSRNSRNSSIV